MHDGSQVQDDGRQDASDVANCTRESRHCCQRCRRSFKQEKSWRKHQEKCLSRYQEEDEGRAWVQCQECGFIAKSLGKHITQTHKISITTYQEKYPNAQLLCRASKKRYSEQNRSNCDWIRRKQEAGEDLAEYREKMGKAVSEAIMANPAERARRAGVIAKLNKRADFRARASETAKITSARPEIQAARAKNLATWRENNPDKFRAIIDVMLSTWHSRPEKLLFECLQAEFSFLKHNQMIYNAAFETKTRRRQLDVACKKRKIVVEFDGPHHFKPIHGDEHLGHIRKKDIKLNCTLISAGYVVIRVANSMYDYSKKELNPRCITDVKRVIMEAKPGLYLFGDEYDEEYRQACE